MTKHYQIAVDYDGTVAEHAYPDNGKIVPGAIDWMKRWREEAGARVMLWTMRSGLTLISAVEHVRLHGFEFNSVNENPRQKVWTSSPKLYANRYVDDLAFGCPLIQLGTGSWVVDWDKVGPAVLAEAVEYNRRKLDRNSWLPARLQEDGLCGS